MTLLLLGFWKLQIVESDRYAQLAELNRIRTIPVIAPRGVLLDRKGRVLVDNYPSFSVLLLRDDLEEVERLLPQISDGMSMPIEDLRKHLEDAKTLPRFSPMVIKPEASAADIAFIESHRADVPVLELLLVHRRRYPADGSLAHVSGYVGEVSAQQVQASEGRYRSGDIVGKTGLERQYNDHLMGTDGMRRVIVNSAGREVGRLEQTDAIPGKPIQLTIDADLQAIAERALVGKKGAVVALNPQTGEVLAMASQPAYNPNDFAISVPRDEWVRLNNDPDRPLLNRAIQAQLAPGSVFKIVMSAAMLESKVVPANYSLFCPGHGVFYGRLFRDWKPEGHGYVDMRKAIIQSCDVFYYNLGQQMGIDKLAYYATQMGLGKKTGIDLPGEEGGLVPSEAWKQRVYKQRWYPGETISVAIGQGALMTTPLQLAYTIGGIATGGVFKQPHLVLSNQAVPEIRFALAESTVDAVTSGMYGVVNEGGTAAASRIPGIEFSGKTGTAQTISAQGLARAGSRAQFKDNAWFVGLAPRRNPEIVVAVLVEGGEHGSSAAAPVARDVVKMYYEKKNGKPLEMLLTQAPAGPTLQGIAVRTADESEPVERTPPPTTAAPAPATLAFPNPAPPAPAPPATPTAAPAPPVVAPPPTPAPALTTVQPPVPAPPSAEEQLEPPSP
jgi:penicillin-binding protein 2